MIFIDSSAVIVAREIKSGKEKRGTARIREGEEAKGVDRFIHGRLADILRENRGG